MTDAQENSRNRIFMALLISGVPLEFVLSVNTLSQSDEDVLGMVLMLEEMDSQEERDMLLADIAELVEDYDYCPGPTEISDLTGRDVVERELQQRMALKTHIRSLVEHSGGVVEVAKRAGMPQPSLSRFLNTPSEPRRGTLKRLAEAMEIPIGRLLTVSGSYTVDLDIEPRLILDGATQHRYGMGKRRE